MNVNIKFAIGMGVIALENLLVYPITIYANATYKMIIKTVKLAKNKDVTRNKSEMEIVIRIVLMKNAIEIRINKMMNQIVLHVLL